MVKIDQILAKIESITTRQWSRLCTIILTEIFGQNFYYRVPTESENFRSLCIKIRRNHVYFSRESIIDRAKLINSAQRADLRDHWSRNRSRVASGDLKPAICRNGTNFRTKGPDKSVPKGPKIDPIPPKWRAYGTFGPEIDQWSPMVT